MTSVTVLINAVPYSNYVLEADLWRDTQNGIGRWQVILDPAGAFNLFGVFNVDNSFLINIDGVLMMRGYLDDIRPHLDDKGYHTGLYRLTGRDYGLDLAHFFYKPIVFDPTPTRGNYRNTRSGDIIRDVITNLQNAAIFGAGNPEFTAPGAGIGNFMDYEWVSRTNLADGFREIALLDNHDFYVTDTAPPAFTYFPVGSVASGVTLIDIAGSATNNILDLDVGEQLGLDMKNYIEAFAGSLDDHWTDLNGTDNATTGWNSGNATCTVGNNYTGAPAPGPFGPLNFEMLGLTSKTSIYCERSVAPAGNWLEMYLDFAALLPVGNGYNQGGFINLEDSSYIRYLVVQEDTDPTGVAWNNVSVGLQDTAGNIIYYRKAFGAPPPPVAAPNKQGYTGHLVNGDWYDVTCHVGFDVRIGAAWPTTDFWYFIPPALAFNWAQVERIWFSTLMASPNPSWFVIDGLQIPTVDVSALAQSVVTPSPGYRMRAVDRQDLTNQVELQNFVDDYLNKHVDPLETLKCTTIGQTGTQYAGETVEVIAPNFGIGTAPATTVTYRILSLHHRVVKNSDDSDYPGFTFLTDYDLVKDQVDGADQELDPTRYYRSIAPEDAWRRDKRIWEKYKRTKRIKTSYVGTP